MKSLNTDNTGNHETKIIETAKRLFIEKGYVETNMSDIAAEAGINRPTLHYYFRTKDKMFQAVFGDIVSTIAPKIQSIFTGDISFLDKVNLLLDEYIRIFSEYPDLPRFILQEAHRDAPHLINTLKSMQFDKYPKLVEKYLLNKMQLGHLKTVPISIVFLTFYSQLLFPVVGKNIVINLFCSNEDDYRKLMQIWKQHILSQMKNLLCFD